MSTDISIRPITDPAELIRCAEFMVASNPWNRLYFDQAQCEESLAHPSIDTHGAFSESGELVGFVAVKAEGIKLSRSSCTSASPSRIGEKGIGTQLISFFEDTLFPDADNLYLFVSDINPDAIRLYTRLGYERVGAFPNFNLVGQTEFLHRKSRRPIQAARQAAALA